VVSGMSELSRRLYILEFQGSWPTLVNRGIDELFRLIERARILGNPMSISSSFTKVGHEPQETNTLLANAQRLVSLRMWFQQSNRTGKETG